MQRPNWIAELDVVIVHPDGRRVPGHIAVGHPYPLGGHDPPANYESHCLVEITDVFSPPMPAIAGGTLRALIGGLQVLGARLHAFAERGGRVIDAIDGSDVDLKLLFGAMFDEHGGMRAG